jgi:hypothetical protein
MNKLGCVGSVCEAKVMVADCHSSIVEHLDRIVPLHLVKDADLSH